MSNILEQLKLKNHHEYVFDDGTKVGFHYPEIESFILEVGQIPLPALNDVKDIDEEKAVELVTQNPDTFRQQLEMTRRVVASMLDDINGEPLDPEDDRLAIVAELGSEKRQTLFLIATRQMDPEKEPVQGEA